MNEEMTGKCLRQVEHIRGHLWHRYSITVKFKVFLYFKVRWRLFMHFNLFVLFMVFLKIPRISIFTITQDDST